MPLLLRYFLGHNLPIILDKGQLETINHFFQLQKIPQQMSLKGDQDEHSSESLQDPRVHSITAYLRLKPHA